MIGIKDTQQLEIGNNLLVKNIRFALLTESAPPRLLSPKFTYSLCVLCVFCASVVGSGPPGWDKVPPLRHKEHKGCTEK